MNTTNHTNSFPMSRLLTHLLALALGALVVWMWVGKKPKHAILPKTLTTIESSVANSQLKQYLIDNRFAYKFFGKYVIKEANRGYLDINLDDLRGVAAAAEDLYSTPLVPTAKDFVRIYFGINETPGLVDDYYYNVAKFYEYVEDISTVYTVKRTWYTAAPGGGVPCPKSCDIATTAIYKFDAFK